MRPISQLILTLGSAASLHIDVVDWKQTVYEEVASFNNGFWEKVQPPTQTDGNWTWKLSNSLMEPIAEEGLCRVLPGDVLVIGDSVTKYSFVTFKLGMQHVAGETLTRMTSGSDQWQGDEGPQGEQLSFHLCNKSRKFTYLRTDNGKFLFFDALVSEYSIVIYNTGAHHKLDTTYNDTIIQAVDQFKNHPQYGHNVFFRTTVPGTPDCEQKDHLPPYSTVAEAEEHKVFTAHPWYNGHEFKRMNEIAKDIFIDAGYSVLDAYVPSILRQDGHKSNDDCLHYRNGAGPAWHWYKLFYNILLRRHPNRRIAA